jgi:hypothetical protein
MIQVRGELISQLDSSFLDSLIGIIRRPPRGKCGPANLDPIADRRAFGWCRFQELIESCNGFPKWEYFVPRDFVFTATGAPFPLSSPDQYHPISQLDVLYNRPAYCHVRTQGLYKQWRTSTCRRARAAAAAAGAAPTGRPRSPACGPTTRCARTWRRRSRGTSAATAASPSSASRTA